MKVNLGLTWGSHLQPAAPGSTGIYRKDEEEEKKCRPLVNAVTLNSPLSPSSSLPLLLAYSSTEPGKKIYRNSCMPWILEKRKKMYSLFSQKVEIGSFQHHSQQCISYGATLALYTWAVSFQECMCAPLHIHVTSYILQCINVPKNVFSCKNVYVKNWRKFFSKKI